MVSEHQSEAGMLAERFRRGDEDCLDQILRGICPAICRVLGARSQFRDLAPDELEHVVSNSLHDAWLVHGDYDPARGTFFGWLMAIAYHAAANFARLPEIRARRLRVAIQPDVLAESTEAPAIGQTDCDAISACRTNLIEMVRVAWSDLPDQLRRVSLADAASPEGRVPTAALAAELGVTPATIRDYRRRARPRLKAKLVDLGIEEFLGAPRARPLLNRDADCGQNGQRTTDNHRSGDPLVLASGACAAGFRNADIWPWGILWRLEGSGL